jgi:hypothetical protein
MGKNIFIQFIEWHFLEMPQEILRLWRNFLRFNLNYFSLSLLAKTLFSHWRRHHYSYGRGFDFKRYLEVWSFNAISRGLGAIVRSILIVTGLLSEIFIILVGLIIFLIWLILPVLLILGLGFGVKVIF